MFKFKKLLQITPYIISDNAMETFGSFLAIKIDNHSTQEICVNEVGLLNRKNQIVLKSLNPLFSNLQTLKFGETTTAVFEVENVKNVSKAYIRYNNDNIIHKTNIDVLSLNEM